MRFTVIIPALNEEQFITRTISRVQQLNHSAEILVVDGGSTDGTKMLCERAGVRVITSQRGRGIQCNAGAVMASGDVLLFLHADTLLPVSAFEIIEHSFQDESIHIGTFRLAFDEDRTLLRFYSAFTRFDSIFTRFGDQCIVVRQSFFMQLGGFPDWPLFEDVHLLRTARQKTKVVSFPCEVITSARRFLSLGLIRTQIFNGLLLLLYYFGVSPVVLSNWYSARRRRFIQSGIRSAGWRTDSIRQPKASS